MSKEIIQTTEIFEIEHDLFFEHLWNNVDMQKFFFTHRKQLFPEFSDDYINIQMPFLFWSNLPQNIKKSSLDVLNIQTEFAEIKRSQSMGVLNDFTSNIKNELDDILYYYLIKFLNNNKKLVELAQNDDFSYISLKKELKDYKNINYNIFDDLEDIISNNSDSKITSMMNFGPNIKRGINEIENNWFELINALDFSHIKGGLFLEGYQKIIKHLNNSHIKIKDYENILAELYSLKLIENFGTVFWCSQCLDEPFITHTISNIHPSHYNLKCPKCNKKMYYLSGYVLDESILDYINDPDGLLKYAFSWLLKDNKDIQIENSVYSSKYENDCILTYQGEKYLVEIKMHNTSKDSDSVKEHFIKDLTQIKKHLNTFEQDNIEIKHSFLLTNHLSDTNFETIQKALNGFKKYQNKITVVDYKNVKSIIDSIAHT